MTSIQAKNLTIGDIHRLFGFQRQYLNSFIPLLTLEPLTELEQQEVLQIRNDFDNYLIESKVFEGMVKVLTTFPLMRLAGFYRYPIKISWEENIETIHIVDEDTDITGRIDILGINKERSSNNTLFWILVIESKNSSIDTSAGLPQLLTYAHQTIKQQESVWGLSTNGQDYQFVDLLRGTSPTYQLLPKLNLMNNEGAIQILQVLKAICKL